MESFKDSITSPAWWIGVVVVGILINMLSEYLSFAMPKTLGRIATARRNSSAKRKQQFEEEVELMTQMMLVPHLATQCEIESAKREIEIGLGWILIALSILLFATAAKISIIGWALFVFIIGLILAIIGMAFAKISSDHLSIRIEALKRATPLIEIKTQEKKQVNEQLAIIINTVVTAFAKAAEQTNTEAATQESIQDTPPDAP